MNKKKVPTASFPEMDAILEGMNALLTDEYGHPLPPDHPRVKQLQNLAGTLGDSVDSSSDPEEGNAVSGHA